LGGDQHDRHEFYQLSGLTDHQRGSVRDTALLLQILRDAWTLVVLREGCGGMDRRLAGLASLWALAYAEVWYIPAILGALALIIVAVDVATMAMMRSGAPRKR
jgi:hypothetical protein